MRYRILSDPFSEIPDSDENKANRDDRTVRYLFGVLEDLIAHGGSDASELRDHVHLWKKIEDLRLTSAVTLIRE